MSEGELSLAHKLDKLFQTVHRPGGKEYSYEAVAENIRQANGPTISATYIWQLRKGIRNNPTKKHLEALARFFGVAPAYFFDDDFDAPARRIACRVGDLSPHSLRAIEDLVEAARKLEGLHD
jgi:transcriptional regulator with XRE-family HTH domain